MSKGPSLSIRPLADGDTDDVVALCAACAEVEAGLGPITAEQWRSFVARPRFGGGRDFRVALDGPRAVGLAESSLRNQDGRLVRYVKIVVDPGARRRGVGTALLGALLDQDSGEDVSFHGHVHSGWSAGRAFCRSRGFEVIESEYRMRCDDFRPAGSLDAGIGIERARDAASCAARLAEIHNAAFRDDVSFTPRTADDMVDALRGMELWVAVASGAIVGHALVEREAGSDWLESLAVLPSFSGRGFGTALAVKGLTGGRAGGGRAAGLSVSSRNPAALHIYRKLGFRAVSEKLRVAALRRDLCAAAGGRRA